MKKYISLLFICLCSFGCLNKGDWKETTRDNILVSFEYDLTSPSQRYKLSGKLREISGIAYFQEGILACINDEEGKVYFYNTHKQEIHSAFKFAKKGDFEGITLHKGDIYVLRSDGKIYHFGYSGLDKLKASEIKTPFTGRNDLEGIAYHVATNSLLLACKNKADINDNGVTGRAIYQFDLSNSMVIDQPFINFKSNSFKNTLIEFGLKTSHHMPFMPSGISVHPETGHIFIISSVGRLLLEIDKDKKIIAAIPLSRKLFLQPEGICFDESGNLFIASEGRSGYGYILKFIPEQDH